jgi:hypothetical protein
MCLSLVTCTCERGICHRETGKAGTLKVPLQNNALPMTRAPNHDYNPSHKFSFDRKQLFQAAAGQSGGHPCSSAGAQAKTS